MEPIFIPFGEWLPDLPPFQNEGVLEAINVFPAKDSYRASKALTVFATSGISNSVGIVVAGTTQAVAPNGTTHNFAGATRDLYRTNSGTAIVAASGFALTNDSYWQFAQFGDTIYAVGGESVGNAVVVQQNTLGAATFVAGIGGSQALRARSIAAVRDFLVLGNVHQDTSASGTFNQRVRWSGINNPDTWTPDTATLADFQDLPGDGGPIMKIIGGDFGTILQRNSVWRMTFVGSPLVFQFDQIHKNIGALNSRVAVGYQNMSFFLSDQGFYAFDGINLKAIGKNKINNTFLSAADLLAGGLIEAARFISTVVYPEDSIVIWNIAANVPGFRGLLAYNWELNKWSRPFDGTSLAEVCTFLSTDTSMILGGFVHGLTAKNMQLFNGSAQAATITTREFQLFPGQRAQITKLRGIVEGLSASYTLAVLERNNLTESTSVNTAVAPLSNGSVPVRSEARYHRIRLTTSNNFDFLQGVEITEATPTGKR